MVKKCLFLVSLFLFIPVFSYAEPLAIASEYMWDFGTVETGLPLRHAFVLKNIGTSDLHIIKMIST